MKLLQSLTITIPAYNEENNIKLLLEDLLKQSTDTFATNKIIINSDGSTDNTNSLVKSIIDPRIMLIENNETLGQPARQNEMLRLADTDIVVLLNADIQITDSHFIEKLIKPVQLNGADLTSCDIKEKEPKTFFERIIYYSMAIKKEAFHKLRGGNNIYTCHGPARALSKRFYSILEFKNGAGEDAYSYLKCVSLGFKYRFVKNTFVEYRLSNNFTDYRIQNARYLKSKESMSSYFDKELTKKEYYLPPLFLLKTVIPKAIKNPVYLVAYVLIYFISNVIAAVLPTPPNWKAAASSKVVRKGV